MERLFPRLIDNRFSGKRAALWLLALLVALKLLIGINSVLNTRQVAAGADGFPLDRYGPEAANSVLMLFAANAVAQIALALIGVLALVRYRAMTPLVFLLFTLEFAARRLVIAAYAVERTGSSQVPLYVNGTMASLLLGGLLLSLWPAARAD
jgi:hypothetical protein